MVIAIFSFYKEGFRNLTLGKSLWKIIVIKLFILFGVLQFLLFDDNLHTLNDEQKSDFVFQNLIIKENK